MKQEYDFSKAVRGKFFREGAELQLPICSDRGSNTHQGPNLFNYATKELSQDAVICWLIACAAEATGDLQKCGLEFAYSISGGVGSDGAFRCWEPMATNGDSPRWAVRRERREQCPNLSTTEIDVYFQAKVDGKKVSFIIEDKKDGSTDSNNWRGI